MSSVRFPRRRDFLHTAGLGLCGLSFTSTFPAHSAPAPGEALEPLNRFPHMVQEWLIARVREAEKRGDAKRAALQTKDDALAYVASCRERIRRSFGLRRRRRREKERAGGIKDCSRQRRQRLPPGG